MLKTRFILSAAVLLLPGFVFAQTTDEALKERARKRAVLISQVTSEIAGFKLPENRAHAAAKIGAVYCKIDREKSGSLFQIAVNELINAQSLAEETKSKSPHQNELLTGQQTRPQILQAIAVCDAEFALESLYKTRPAVISKALAAAPEKSRKISNYGSNRDHYAQSEMQLEHNLVRLAADQNPERAVSLLKESLKKGVSTETLNLLNKLREKDPLAANEMGSEILSSLNRASFSKNNQPDYQKINVATNILTDYIREKGPAEKYLKFDESQIRALSDKLISFFIEQPQWQGYISVDSIIQIAEKLSPSTVATLKETQKRGPIYGNGFHRGLSYDPKLNELLSKGTAAELLSEARNFPVEFRQQIYQTAANKMSQEGDFDGAREILSDNFDDDALEESLNSLNWNYSHHLINTGKFEEAEQAIDQFPENNRISALISLAQTVFNSDREKNKTYAQALLRKIRDGLPAKPENSNEMSQFVQMVSAYSIVEPLQAFEIFESLVPQLNELADASAIVQQFQGGTQIRDGEALLSQGHVFGFYPDFSMFQKLAESDFDRTVKLVDSLTRKEMRVSLKLQLAESYAN